MSKTRSETLFERWLDYNHLPWCPIAVAAGRTPDYRVTVASGADVIFEVKEITGSWDHSPGAVHSRTVGKHVRSKIAKSRRQVQDSSTEGLPTITLIYNALDPMQWFGTEDHDFEHAMYGDRTVTIDRASGRIVDSFHGNNKAFQADKNTSFSALARLKESGREAIVSVTVFENIHAKVPLPYDRLPPCFVVIRVERPAIRFPFVGDQASLP
jgi:hypothetical protein